jgi:hypothetical protein
MLFGWFGWLGWLVGWFGWLAGLVGLFGGLIGWVGFKFGLVWVGWVDYCTSGKANQKQHDTKKAQTEYTKCKSKLTHD